MGQNSKTNMDFGECCDVTPRLCPALPKSPVLSATNTWSSIMEAWELGRACEILVPEQRGAQVPSCGRERRAMSAHVKRSVERSTAMHSSVPCCRTRVTRRLPYLLPWIKHSPISVVVLQVVNTTRKPSTQNPSTVVLYLGLIRCTAAAAARKHLEPTKVPCCFDLKHEQHTAHNDKHWSTM